MEALDELLFIYKKANLLTFFLLMLINTKMPFGLFPSSCQLVILSSKTWITLFMWESHWGSTIFGQTLFWDGVP
jgi:hypothetical protein